MFKLKPFIAEFIGTAVLVLVGCGAVTIGGYGASLPVGVLPIAAAFGLAVTAMAYAIGPVSGCHINPAVTLSMVAAGRMSPVKASGYIVAQVLGAFAGAYLLTLLLADKGAAYDVVKSGLGQNGWGVGYLGAYGQTAAIIVEFVATFIFTAVILGATQKGHATPVAGLVIGLTLFVLHLPFLNVTGLSVNPARSLAPAIFVGGTALQQVWLFLVVPAVAGVVSGLLFKMKILSARSCGCGNPDCTCAEDGGCSDTGKSCCSSEEAEKKAASCCQH